MGFLSLSRSFARLNLFIFFDVFGNIFLSRAHYAKKLYYQSHALRLQRNPNEDCEREWQRI